MKRNTDKIVQSFGQRSKSTPAGDVPRFSHSDWTYNPLTDLQFIDYQVQAKEGIFKPSFVDE